MLPSSGGRRLLALLRRTAAASAGSTNPFQPHPHASCFSHVHFSTRAATALDSESPHTTASYLVASWGLSPAAAAAAAEKVALTGIRVISTDKADAILVLLRRYGFSDAQIALLIRLAPKILLLDPGKNLRPKLEFFVSLGFKVDWLANRNVLERSLDKHIIPCVEFLRGILGNDANIQRAVRLQPYALSFDIEKGTRALQALRHHGLPDKAISKLLVVQIGVLWLAPDRIAGIFEDLRALGLPFSDSRIVYCVRAMVSINRETWLRKVALYRSLGVSEDELLRAFKKQASIMTISDENLKTKIRFFLDELKLDLSYVMQRPVILGYSMEKCILPRCAVMSVLMKEGKIEPDTDILKALLGASKTFYKRYVLRYADDVPDVVEAYEGRIEFEGFKDQMV